MIETLFIICLPFQWNDCTWNFQYYGPDRVWPIGYTIDGINKQILLSNDHWKCNPTELSQSGGVWEWSRFGNSKYYEPMWNGTIWSSMFNQLEMTYYKHNSQPMESVRYFKEC